MQCFFPGQITAVGIPPLAATNIGLPGLKIAVLFLSPASRKSKVCPRLLFHVKKCPGAYCALSCEYPYFCSAKNTPAAHGLTQSDQQKEDFRHHQPPGCG